MIAVKCMGIGPILVRRTGRGRLENPDTGLDRHGWRRLGWFQVPVLNVYAERFVRNEERKERRILRVLSGRVEDLGNGVSARK